MKGWGSGAAIDCSPRITVIGGPFKSQAAATEDGKRTRQAILLWALQRRLAVDLGDSRKRGGLTKAGAQRWAGSTRVPMRDNLHGLDVYEKDAGLRFFNSEGQLSQPHDAEGSVRTIAAWYEANLALSEKQALAAELYCASHFDAPFRSRFLTLMTALEAFLDHEHRSEAERDVVTTLEAVVTNSALTADQKKSLLSSLQWFHNESIGQAGRRTAQSLLPQGKYADRNASKYFSWCYDLRSTIVHSGQVPKDVDLLAVTNELHRFVGDLLHASIGIPAV